MLLGRSGRNDQIRTSELLLMVEPSSGPAILLSDDFAFERVASEPGEQACPDKPIDTAGCDD